MNDAIKQAENVLETARLGSADGYAGQTLFNTLSAMIALAKAQEAELARLKAPLGDEGKALVAKLNALGNDSAPAWKLGLLAETVAPAAAAYIEHLSAALAAPVDADVEELAEKLGADRLTYEERWRLVSMLHHISRENWWFRWAFERS